MALAPDIELAELHEINTESVYIVVLTQVGAAGALPSETLTS